MFWSPGAIQWSGVAILSKFQSGGIWYGIDGRFEDRVLTLKFSSFYLVTVYSPYAGLGLEKLSNRLDFDQALVTFLANLSDGRAVIVCGDLNVAYGPLDVHPDEVAPRMAGLTEEEKSGFTAFLEQGFIDVYRSLNPTCREFSFWRCGKKRREKAIGWRLDYFLLYDPEKGLDMSRSGVSSGFLGDIPGSDHCPIFMRLPMSKYHMEWPRWPRGLLEMRASLGKG